MGRRHFESGPEFPIKLDNKDNLRRFREKFFLKKNTIYLCGNSLGLASQDSEKAILDCLNVWKEDGIDIYQYDNNKYHLYSSRVAQHLAPCVGADVDEVAIVGNTTTNIHQAISTFYKPTKDKYKILVDDLNFPSDRYAVDSQVRLKSLDPNDAVKVVKSADGKFIYEDDVIEAMTEDVALVFLPSVVYRTAQIVDMTKVTNAAKQRGIIIGWDLCHAAGVVDVDLKAVDADFAVWCTYKYLNGGPGSPAGLYINRKHFSKTVGLAGWYGNKIETQFKMKQTFDQQHDARGWQIGCPFVMSIAGLEGALKTINEATMPEIRKKSLHITGYMMYLSDIYLSSYGFKIGNPKEDHRRGGHVCLEHDEGYRISLVLKKRNIIVDFREPNVIRLTPTPLYTSYGEVYKVIENLVDIMRNESYKLFSTKRLIVT